jgi:hypothetical protein
MPVVPTVTANAFSGEVGDNGDEFAKAAAAMVSCHVRLMGNANELWAQSNWLNVTECIKCAGSI